MVVTRSTSYAAGVTRLDATGEFCGANFWSAARVGAAIGWECVACGDLDDRHPLVCGENDRTEEDP
jgi:hypothetical protein